MTVNNGLLTLTCVDCSKTYVKKIDENLSKRFKITYHFFDGDINKFCLVFRRGVYIYDYMDGCERFNETLLPVKEEFYNSLTMESIKHAEYKQIKRVWKGFESENQGQYYDLYLPSDTVLLAGIFESFRNKCLEIYEIQM